MVFVCLCVFVVMSSWLSPGHWSGRRTPTAPEAVATHGVLLARALEEISGRE